MKRNIYRARNLFLITCTIVFFVFTLQGFRYEAASVIGNSVSDFTLKNVNGNAVSLKDYPDAKGFIIVFTSNHCPFARLYNDRLNELNTKYEPLHVPLLAINSMDTALYLGESLEDMKQRAESAKFNFPYLHDPMQSVLKDFKADHTPQAYVVWKENSQWKIEYSGAIDDNGANPGDVTRAYVATAVDELLSGKQVSDPETHSVGCAILYRK